MKYFSFDRWLLAVNNHLFTLKINHKLYKPSICPSSPVHAWVSWLFSAFILEEALAGWGRERKGWWEGGREGGERKGERERGTRELRNIEAMKNQDY